MGSSKFIFEHDKTICQFKVVYVLARTSKFCVVLCEIMVMNIICSTIPRAVVPGGNY